MVIVFATLGQYERVAFPNRQTPLRRGIKLYYLIQFQNFHSAHKRNTGKNYLPHIVHFAKSEL